MNSNDANSILIGITGGIASGKSTMINYLNEKGYSTIEADQLGHKILDISFNWNNIACYTIIRS